MPYSEEEIQEQENKVKELEYARQELDGMKMDNEMQTEKNVRFNNQNLDFHDSYSKDGKTYTYDRYISNMDIIPNQILNI